jgi:hypothetical protein
MNSIIENYKKIKSAIPELIEMSGYRNDYIAKRMGMKPANFSVKKQRGNWNEDELEQILNALTNPTDDVENFLMLQEMRSLKDDENITADEFKKAMKWK